MFWIVLSAVLIAAVFFYNVFISFAMKRALKSGSFDPETGILKGAEDVFLQGTSGTAVLMIHGYIGSPTDYGDLPKILHAKGLTVSVPLLPGHGRGDPREFRHTSAEEIVLFIQKHLETLQRTHAKAVLAGFSMGGAAAVLASQAARPDALILLAPYFDACHKWYYVFPLEFYYRTLRYFIPYVYRFKCFKQLKDRSAGKALADYDFISLEGSAACLHINKKARRLFPELTCMPVLMIASRNDQAVCYRAIQQAAACAKTRLRFVTVENSNHLICVDYDKETAAGEVLRFLADEELLPPS